MSRVLPQFPKIFPKSRALPKYNWPLWLDGRVHALSASEYGDPYTFRNSAHIFARRHGLRVKTAVHNNEMIIQARGHGTERATRPPIPPARGLVLVEK